MTDIVVDTNIVFSALLNTDSRIAQILIIGKKHFDFYAPEYMREEIINHKQKIKKIAQLNENQFQETYHLITKNIDILNHQLISEETFNKAFNLCKNIDEDDTIFLALNEYIKGTLWTGDKKLIQGLLKYKYSKIITTEHIYQKMIKLDRV